MNPEVMLDIETMGNGNKAAIVSIGAVKFDENGIAEKFYAVVDLESSVAAGMVVDPSTVMWWLKQSQEARDALTSKPGIPLEDALHRLFQWYGGNLPTWGNGATFDNVIVRNAYTAVGLPCPWKFQNDRCYRTLKAMFPFVARPEDNNDAHNALSDARWQAEHLLAILKHVRG